MATGATPGAVKAKPGVKSKGTSVPAINTTATKTGTGGPVRKVANISPNRKNQPSAAPTNNQSDGDTTLSRYLHSIFEPVLQCDNGKVSNKPTRAAVTPQEKIDAVHRMNTFLSGQTSNRQQMKQQFTMPIKKSSAAGSLTSATSIPSRSPSSVKTSSAKSTTTATKNSTFKNPSSYKNQDNCLKNNLFSPLVSDVHVSIHPPKVDDSKRRRGTTGSHPNNGVVGIHSGIQLPPVEWHRDFRKGYSLLMWVCFHDDTDEDEDDVDTDDNFSGVGSFLSTSSTDSDPQLLYRFATSASPLAHGVQATICKDTEYNDDDSNINQTNGKKKMIPVTIQIDTFKPSPTSTSSSPSKNLAKSPKIDALQSNNVPISLITKRKAFIPNHQWTLICIQHSFPYLKRPTVTVSVNGVEIEKGELAYPTLGGETGEVMMDNYLLCNIPNTIHKRQSLESSLNRVGIQSTADNNTNESVLNISKIDFAGFGLFKEAIPTLLQAILCEHGPCSAADGVIPSVPPVVQCRDGIVIGTGSTSLNEGNNGSSQSVSSGGVLRSTGAGVLGSPSKRSSNLVSNGPFSLSSHRTSNVSEGRGIGIPLTTGVQLTEEVSHKGQLFLQQLLSKLVLGINGSSAFKTGGRVAMNVNDGSNIGITSDVKIVGIVQPKSSKSKGGGENKGRNSHRMIDDINTHVARGIGNVTIYHATEEFMALEQKRLQGKSDSVKSLSLLPTFQPPSSPISGFNKTPSFLSTYLSINSLSYILQPFHLSLPPPGQMHSLQRAYYHDSFEHLYDLVVYNGGALAASLIKLFATNLYLGGRMREEIIHSGGLHTLNTLLRRVLLRVNRLGMMSCKGRDGKKRLWQIYAPKESSDDENCDFDGIKDMAPNHIPSEITNACKWIITACSGPAVENGMKWKRPSLPVHVRRTSDIALTSIFGIALDMDLWGGDPVAASEILGEVVNLFCGDSHDQHLNPTEITEKYDSGYGRLLRGHISIQYLLDMVRLRFGSESIVQRNGATNDISTRAAALKSLAASLSKIFYTLMKYSLFKQISQGEHDISAVVAALSDCPLGSVVAHASLTALRDILIYCEIFPNYFVGSAASSVNKKDTQTVKTLLEGANLGKPTLNLQQCVKLKRIKSEIAGHLARNLLLGQFHDVVAPMLLSRTVFDGRRNTDGNDRPDNLASIGSGSSVSSGGVAGDETAQQNFVQYEWQNHWIITLQLFVWLASVARSEGEKVSDTTGSLLLQSGKAGSLSSCLANLKKLDFVSLFAPTLSTPSSAVTPGSISGKEAHAFDTSNRLRVIYQLLGGIIASIVSNDEDNKSVGSADGGAKKPTLFSKSAMITLTDFTSVMVSMILYIQDKDLQSLYDSRRRRQKSGNTALVDKVLVRAAIGAVPSLVLMSVLLEQPIQDFKLEFNSDKSWDFVEKNGAGLNQGRATLEEQLQILTSCQTSAMQTAAILIAKAMVVGGGEASTIILKDVVSRLNLIEDHGSRQDEKSDSNGFDSSEIKNHLLCRLISMVLMKIVSRKHKEDDPWKSVELCSATARLCDLVEEKKLLQYSKAGNVENSPSKMALDQVRLLCAILNVMEAGRENTGWCQIISPGTVNDPIQAVTTSMKEKSSLVDMLMSFELVNIAKHVDYEMLARTDGIYHLIHSHDHESIEIFDKGQSAQNSTNPQSFSTSKLLLPILQPSLRTVLSCLDEIRSAALVQNTSGNGGKSLLSIVIEELRLTLTAAIVGLAFPHARDLCLSALSLLRKSIEYHESEGDAFVGTMYRDLFVNVVKEMRVRYESERKKREVAELFSSDAQVSSQEAANSLEVQKLLMGGSFVEDQSNHQDKSDIQENPADISDDFIVFPENGNQPSAMGWNGYKGFGSALEKCEQSDGRQDDNSEAAISILSPYLDTWDEKQLMEDEESELVELFDTASVGLHEGVATAADSMTSFIELASSESSRMNEIKTFLLPYKRYNSFSFSDVACWKAYLEFFFGAENGIHLFERCVADAGRDYGGRLLTVPIHPQFSRTIPKQLDHSINVPAQAINEDLNTSAAQLTSVDLDGLNDLVKQASIKIVDITKKNEDEDDMKKIRDDHGDELDESDNVLVSKPSMDSDTEPLIPTDDADEATTVKPKVVEPSGPDELYLGFPERPDEEESIVSDLKDKEDVSLSIRSGIDTNNLDVNEQSSLHSFFMSSFANPPNSTSSSFQGHLHHGTRDGTSITGWGGLVEDYYDNCVHVKPEGNRKGTLLVTSTYLIFEYDDPTGLTESEVLAIDEMNKKAADTESIEDKLEYDKIIRHYTKTAGMRPKSMRWNIHELSHVYLRRYRLRDSAFELFFIPSGGSTGGGVGLLSALSSIWLDFGPGSEGHIRRDDAANAIMKRAPPSTIKQWPDRSGHFLHEHLRNITLGWVKGRMNNFDYLLALNILSGRSFNDLCQYPVFPWVLSNYTSQEIPDLTDESNFRDLSKPMGALNPQRLEEFIERFQSFDDAMIPPFMYGSHYSTSAGVVLHFLVRMHPFASLHRQLQGGHFDVADRLFSSVSRTWDMCTGQSAAEVKELTPEWYCNPSFLKNANHFKLGTSQEGEYLDDVALPPWANGSADKFVEVLRCALESDLCTRMLPDWIDLIFGRKQQGPASVEAHNVFFYLTYYGSCDVASIEDDDLRIATELQIAHFGQCPMQLFWRPHVSKLPKSSDRRRLSLSELLNLYQIQCTSNIMQRNDQLIFGSAPLEYWLHLSSPPPGPHAPIVAVRLVLPDRCLGVDSQGIFHFFRFGWKNQLDGTNQDESNEAKEDLFADKGVFVAQRELPHFRTVPRLHYSPSKYLGNQKGFEKKHFSSVAISKCIFNKSLLVISDGDGKGALCLQLVDPAKGIIDGQVIIPSVHSSRVIAIHSDPIGAAAGVGGAGGELAIVGSEDGTATLWRFITNPICTFTLRPRLRLGGHRGMKINAVAISSDLQICASVSRERCCIFSISNGALMSSISISDVELPELSDINSRSVNTQSSFAESNAMSICASGYIALVCTTKYFSSREEPTRELVTLQLFSLEGEHIGFKALEQWRGVPNKIVPTYDGRGIMVCSAGGVSIHLISAIKPLDFVDEWKVANDDEIHSGIGAYDIDFGPSLSRPVLAVSGLSSGALRIHAFKGISEWSEEIHKNSSMTAAVGNVLAKPAERVKGIFGAVKGKGSKVVGFGKEIGREAVSGFLGELGWKKLEM